MVSKSSIEEVTFSEEKIVALRARLLHWFESHGRHWIPWKLKDDGRRPDIDEALNPYPIWIAEVMLQQTQIKVVLPYWKKWMKTFPTLLNLATAREQDVLMIWQGLGYYSRARRLHQSSQILLNVVNLEKSVEPKEWPKDIETWLDLPGIGRTTAGSILSSAFNYSYSILDGNVKRILSRLICNSVHLVNDLPRLWNLSTALLDVNNPRDFNQALMDLGSSICTLYNPKCYCCPLQDHCQAYISNQQLQYPLKGTMNKPSFSVIGVAVIFDSYGNILIDQRLNDGLLGGMWEFPGGKQELGEAIEDTILREIREELDIDIDILKELIVFDHKYTHKRLRFEVYLCRWVAGIPKPIASQQIKWVKPNNLSEYPFPAANSKIIDSLIKYLDEDETGISS